MPIYEYECGSCNARFEIMQKFSDKPLKKCAMCGAGPIVKVLSAPALHFKGTGWYVTDYARAGKKDGKADDGGKSNGTSKSTDSAAPAAAASATKTGD